MNNKSKAQCNTILSQTLSPCNKYLLAGNIFGEIAVISIRSMLKSRTAKGYIMVEKNTPICSLLTTKEFLVAGTKGKIFGWRWEDVRLFEEHSETWIIEIPRYSKFSEKVHVNSLSLLSYKGNDVIIAGCGDNNLYSFCVESGDLIDCYEGHGDFVHSVKYDNTNNQIVSCGEDGSVMMWDFRSCKKVNQIQPYKDSSIQRPHLGKWVGDVDIKDDWLICGGGVKMALWQLKFLEPMTVFNDTFDSGIHVTKFIDEGFIGAGLMSFALCSKFNNTLISRLHTSSSCIYSVAYRTGPSKVVTLAGESNNIDFGTNLNFTDSALLFYDA